MCTNTVKTHRMEDIAVVAGVCILSLDGRRIYSKYYHPSLKGSLSTQEQLEKNMSDKKRRSTSRADGMSVVPSSKRERFSLSPLCFVLHFVHVFWCVWGVFLYALKRVSAEIMILESWTVVYRTENDIAIFFIGVNEDDALLLSAALDALHDALIGLFVYVFVFSCFCVLVFSCSLLKDGPCRDCAIYFGVS